MRYYKHLYLTEGLEKKKEKIICKLEAGRLQPGVHVITLHRELDAPTQAAWEGASLHCLPGARGREVTYATGRG